MKRLMRLLVPGLLFAATTAWGGELPERLEWQGGQLEKVAEAPYRWLFRRVTLSGLYVDPKQAPPPDGDILDPDYAKAVKIEYAVGVSAERFASMTREALEDAWPEAKLETLREEIDRFCDWLRPVSAGDRYTLYWQRESGLSLSHNGSELGRLQDTEAARVILSIWLGRAAVSERQRDDMLAAWRRGAY